MNLESAGEELELVGIYMKEGREASASTQKEKGT